MRFSSLKAHITLLTILLVGMLWLLAVGATWLEAKHESEELFDAHLVQAASLLIVQTAEDLEQEHEDDDHILEESHAPLLHRYSRRVAFQVWIDQKLRLHSANAPAQPLAVIEEGLSDSVVDGERWRVFSAWSERRKALIQVGERAAARDELTNAIAAGLLRPLLVALPALAILIWLAVRHGVRPIERVASEIEKRSPDKLSPLPLANLPDEVLPLVERLNGLLLRVSTSIDQERRFTADAAHELRTPLAGLKAQAQVALGAKDDAPRQHALTHLIQGCDRISHLVEQLLVLARVDAARPVGFINVELDTLAREIVGQTAAQALDKGVEIECEAPAALTIMGNPAWLAVLLRNLTDNAVRHSPPGGKVTVAVLRQQGTVSLEVRDNGPGVAPEELTSLGQRFWRSPSSQGGTSDGSGLGLSIAGRIADLHGGTIAFENIRGESGSGLSVRVQFPFPNAQIQSS